MYRHGVALATEELTELFLALVSPRITAARAAVDADDDRERETRLACALVPLAVDAALLGADAVRSLAHATVLATRAPPREIAAALDALEVGAGAVGGGSGPNASELAVHTSVLRAHVPSLQVEPAPTPAGTDDDTTWVPQIAEDMIAAFLDECVERLDGLSERLLALEERPEDRELVDEIFRDLHTLKGSSAFAGLKKMNRIAHRAEDRIGELRDGTRVSDRALIDVLLETLDVLRSMVDRARARAPMDQDISDLLVRLENPGTPRRAPALVAPVVEVPGDGARGPRAGAAQATLRIDFEKVDELLNLVGEVVLARGRLLGAVDEQGGLLREVTQLRKRATGSVSRRVQAPLVEDLQRTERVLRDSFGDLESGLAGLGQAAGQLRDTVMKLRMVPIARLFTKYQRTVRELSHKLGKELEVKVVGAETELDKVLVERLEDPLLHLVRNAVDHGVEKPEVRERSGKPRAGTVRLVAGHRGGQIVVRIEDDGAGMDPEKLRAKAVEKGILGVDEARALTDAQAYELIFRAGFSTAAAVSDVSGRGVGMDVVRDAIAKLKGTIFIESRLGHGSALELRLPLTLAITQVLAVRAGGEVMAIPLDAVVSAQAITAGELERVGDGVVLRVGDRLIPVVDLGTALGLPEETVIGDDRGASVVIVDVGNERYGLLSRQVLGRHEVVIKSLGPLLAGAPCAAGATLVGDRVLVVVDLGAVVERARAGAGSAVLAPSARAKAKRRARVLVAEDSDVIREALRRELTAAGYEVEVASDGAAALELARQRAFDAVSTDVMMPKMDGHAFTRALREDPSYRSVPVVMVTSKDAKIDSLRGIDAGADAYLTKPTDAAELVRTLERLLSERAPKAS